MQKNTRVVFALFAVIIITAVTFLPSLRNGFTNWDETRYFPDNSVIKNLSLDTVAKFFTSFHFGLYKPLTLLSFSLEYHFFGLNPFVSHAINLVFHLFNCALVFWLIFLLSRRIGISFLTAIFFGIHPLHVESVVWIAERKDVLYAFFFLYALISYVYYAQKKLMAYYYISLTCFILSLLVKPEGITLPLVLLLYDFFSRRAIAREWLKDKIPYFIISFIFIVVNALALKKYLGPAASPVMLDFNSFFVSAYGAIFYLVKIVMPFNLSCLYPYPERIQGFLPLNFILAPAVFFLIATLVFSASKYSKKIVYGTLFYLITVLPVLPLSPLGPAIAAADRYTYIPSVGIFYIFSLFFAWLYNKKFNRNSLAKGACLLFIIAVIATLAYLAFQRTKVWDSSVSLWEDVLKKYPHNPTALINLGNAYFDRGEYDKALVSAKRALDADPEAWEPWLLLGNTYNAKKDLPLAEKFYKKAIQANPNSPEAFNNLGTVYRTLGSRSKALDNFKKALSLDPDLLPVLKNLAGFLLQEESYKEAAVLFKKILKLDRRQKDARIQLGVALAESGSFQEAEKTFLEALEIDPSSFEATKDIGSLYGNLGEFDKAVKFFTKALEMNPGDKNVELLLKMAIKLKGESSK